MNKIKSIEKLLNLFSMEENGWEIRDHWDGDMAAIGIVKKGHGDRLAYIRVPNEKADRYDYELETNSSYDTDYTVAGRGTNVDFKTLFSIIKSHLG